MVRALNALVTRSLRSIFSFSGESFGSPNGCGIDTVGTMRLAPILKEIGTIVHIWTTGTSAVSSMALASVAPQRVQVPQVEVKMTPSTWAALSCEPISLPNLRALATEVPLPTVE